VNVAVAGCALIYVKGMKVRRAALILAASVGSAGVLAWLILPTLASHYWTRLAISFQSLGTTPDAVLSGRISSWRVIGDFLLQQPWHLVFGIGYKTLPYTDLVGHGLVADNTWLGLLIETGLVGLGVFVLLNGAILRTALRAARSEKARASFFGGWMFCFWCGELVQMLSGDLITYWRVLPLYFWVLATAAREAGD
jgi:O-antigen ligase